MKFTVKKDVLASAMATVGKFVATKVQTPILSGVSVTAKEGKLTLQATDYEIGAVVNVPAEVSDEGTVIVAGRYFGEMVRVMPGDEIAIETKGNAIAMKSAKSNFSLLSMGEKDFPAIKPIVSDKKIAVTGSILRELIKKTAFATASDDTRPVFTGVLFDVSEDGTIRMVATNTHRLAYCEAGTLDGGVAFKAIVPKRILDEISRVAGDNDVIDIAASNAEMSFSVGGNLFVTRLIEGNFPDFERVFPAVASKKATIKVADFLPALSRVSLISRASEYNTLKMTFNGNEATLYSDNSAVGKSEESFAIEYEGEPLTINFNASYLMDALKAVSADTITLNMSESLKPVLVKEVGSEAFKYIVTPVRAKA